MWQVTPGQTLRHRNWHDECVVYNDLSGDTHLLDADALAILLALQAGPLSLAALCAALDADAGAIAVAVAALLGQLAEIELVQETGTC